MTKQRSCTRTRRAGRGRWAVLGAVALVTASLIAENGAVASAATPPPAANTTATHPMTWGAYAGPRGNQNLQQSVQALESQLGHKLPVVRVWSNWDSPFPNRYQAWLRDTGHTMIFTVTPVRENGSKVYWSSIANAQPGS